MPPKINHLRWLWNEWKQRKLYIVLLLFMTLLSSTVAVGYPYVLKLLIDDIDNVAIKHITENDTVTFPSSGGVAAKQTGWSASETTPSPIHYSGDKYYLAHQILKECKS